MGHESVEVDVKEKEVNIKVEMSQEEMSSSPLEQSFCTQLLEIACLEPADHVKPAAAGDRDPPLHF